MACHDEELSTIVHKYKTLYDKSLDQYFVGVLMCAETSGLLKNSNFSSNFFPYRHTTKFDYSSLGKSHADFHRMNIKKNARKAVSEELGLEDGKLLLNQSNV